MKNHIIIFISVGLFFFSCNEKKHTPVVEEEIALGVISINVTGAEVAQPYFEKGLLLLHSFEYEDAREAFQEAQVLDSTFAMAYWGEAMSYNHSLWQRQEKEDALAALMKLAPTKEARAEMIRTDLERDFFEAIEILYGEGTKFDRDIAYSNFMEHLTNKYPDHHEVSALYAVSLLGSSRNGRDEKLYNKTARIAQGIIKENPNHPGALHYLIHSYDDPEHAHLAELAADKYAKVAPDAAHALHMPSHIYAALGKWNDVVNSNIASWNAGVNRMKVKELDNDARSYHALNWLQYGLLQRGEYELAERLLRDMMRYASEKPTKVARSYLLSMKGAHMVETESWTGALADIEVDISDLNITKRAQHAFLEGMKAYHAKDIKRLREITSELGKTRYAAAMNIGEKGFALCSSGGFANKPPNQLDVDMVHIMETQLESCIALMEKNQNKAEVFLKMASTKDESLSYSFGPPIILKPIHELYAEFLAERDKNADALKLFEASLNRHPRRLISLNGKKEVAEKLKDEKALADVSKELETSLMKQVRDEIL